jgi:hypothetical protein
MYDNGDYRTLPYLQDRDPTPPRLAHFRNQLVTVSALYLRASEPDYSTRVLQAGLPQTDQQEKVLGPASGRFNRYRELLATTMDVEIGIVRMNAAAQFLCVRPSDEVFSAMNTTYGVWVDNHVGNAAITMMSLFDRTEALLQQAHRRLIRPFDGAATRESPLVVKLRQYSDPLKELRDPYAHAGGAVHWLAGTGRLDQHVLHGTWPLIASVMEHHRDFAESMCNRMQIGAQMSIQAVEVVVGELSAAVPWEAVKKAAEAGRLSP